MYEVKTVAVTPIAAGSSDLAVNLRVGSGRFFSFALPEGWRFGEDGQFALSLEAPDRRAL